MGSRAVLGSRLRLGPGLGPDRPPEGAPLDADRAVRAGDAREREALRRRAALSPPQPRAARRARLPRADRAGGVRRPRREPRRLRDDLRDDRPLRLRLDGDVLRDAHGRRAGDHAPPHARADRQVHPPAQLGPDRHPLVLRPRDRLALLVPGLVARRAARTAATRSTRRRRGRRPAASPTSTCCRRRAPTSRATTTSRSSSSTRSTARRSRRSGTRSACAATSPARSRSPTSRSPARSSSGPRATAPPRTTRRSTRGS